jgi:CRP/FNR family nitrogen fixation transcriptional regulator
MLLNHGLQNGRIVQVSKIALATTASPQSLFGCAELNGVPMSFGRGAEIFGEGEIAENVYRVVGGSVRTYRVLTDGRRQIDSFYLPGDIFGLEAGTEHSCSAEAIGPATIVVFRRNAVLASAERHGDVARQLLSATAVELKRAQAHVLLLIKTAKERLAAFLLEMAERMKGSGAIDLPMSRQDIADYLGLTIETVSRTLTQLTESSTIQLVASRQIRLRNVAALGRLNG